MYFKEREPKERKLSRFEIDMIRRTMQKCPECNEYLSYLTNAHCLTRHDMTKAEVLAKHEGAIINEGTRLCTAK